VTENELIAALESATDGDWKLDLEIMRHTFPDMKLYVEPAIPAVLVGPRLMAKTKSGMDEHVRLTEYTRSLDAAVTLVPDGWGAEIFWHDGSSTKEAFVDLRLPNPRWKDPNCPQELYCTYAALVSSYENDDDGESEEVDPHPLPQAKPLPLAICIAALKARRAMRRPK